MELCAFCIVEETMLYESGVPVCLTCVDRRNVEAKARYKANIHSVLVRDLTEATGKAESATSEFNAISSDVPSHIPQPDGAQRIHSA